MSQFPLFTPLVAAVALLFGVQSCAHAYVDPGTASTIYAVGIAPILAFLGLAGRSVIRFITRKKAEASEEEQDTSDTDTEQ